MFKKKQLKLSALTKASLALPVFFIVIHFSQSGCGGGGTTETDKDSTAAIAETIEAANPGKPTLSGNVPTEVYLPNPDTNNVNNRPAFDRFSWQTFIALCWPVDTNQRGVPLNPNDPRTFLNMSNSTPVVWTSYKNQWDLFGQGNKTPTPWNSWYDSINICNINQKINHVFGTAKSKMLPGEGNESFSVPLIDQNKNYALFEIRYNQVQYNFILNNGLYLNKKCQNYKKSHNGAVTMPVSTATTQGAILVKAAWKLLTSKDDPSRYYVINELVYDPVSQQCHKQLMGLVGLHIAQKVDTFPQWVWSSFEQIDNVPDPAYPKRPYSFNNGTSNPATQNGYANQPIGPGVLPPDSPRVPVQVTRLNEIPTTPAGSSTVNLNKQYQALAGNTWMKYYQLVITQWPTNPSQFKQYTQNGIYPRDCGSPFPVYNSVNTTMETYYQSQATAKAVGGNSCMSCHYTAPDTDFSWSL